MRGLFPSTLKCLHLVNIMRGFKITGMDVLYYLVPYYDIGHNFFFPQHCTHDIAVFILVAKSNLSSDSVNTSSLGNKRETEHLYVLLLVPCLLFLNLHFDTYLKLSMSEFCAPALYNDFSSSLSQPLFFSPPHCIPPHHPPPPPRISCGWALTSQVIY